MLILLGLGRYALYILTTAVLLDLEVAEISL